MQSWYTAKELAGLDDMPLTTQGVRKAALRFGWTNQRRTGSKAQEYSFSSLPVDTQQALIARAVSAPPLPDEIPATVERDSISASRLTDNQRSVMTARLAFVREIERMSKTISQQRAIDSLVALATAPVSVS